MSRHNVNLRLTANKCSVRKLNLQMCTCCNLHINNNNKYITSIALKSSGVRARKRKKKIINQIQESGTYRGHHQYEGPPTI